MSNLYSQSSVAAANFAGVLQRDFNMSVLAALQTLGIQEGAVTTITASRALTMADAGIVLVDTTSGNLILTLPNSSASVNNAVFKIVRIDSSANTLTIQRGGSDTIEGATTLAVVQQETVELVMPSGRTDWYVISREYRGPWHTFTAGPSAATTSASAIEAANYTGTTQYRGAGFNFATGRYTAPVSGIYRFDARVQISSPAATHGQYASFRVNGAFPSIWQSSSHADASGGNASAGPIGHHLSVALPLQRDQYISVFHNTVGGASSRVEFFAGVLLRAAA